MKEVQRVMWPTLLALALALVTAACAASGSDSVQSGAAEEVARSAPDFAPEPGGGLPQAAVALSTPLPETAGGSPGGQRRIIKDGTMAIEVESVDLGLSRLEGIAAQAGGYVIESRTDYADTLRRRAFIRIAVPVENFEASLQRIREASGRVLSESASGVDVSQEYVDVQSQIANLEATQARVRAFLDEAETVEEALMVNQRLTEIDGQLNQAKGRLQYLSQRSAFSTIAVDLQERDLPPAVKPTPTPRPPWQPGSTVGRAVDSLIVLLQGVVEAVIWLMIVVLPALLLLAIPVLLLVWAIRALRRRRMD